jgi:autotransporter-associated beta strand protein
MKSTLKIRTMLLVSCVLIFSGCGGGGSGSSEGWQVNDTSGSVSNNNNGSDSNSGSDSTSSNSGPVTIGVIDSGTNTQNIALTSSDITVYDYLGQGQNLATGASLTASDITASDTDPLGHGTYISEILVGQQTGQFSGGLTPDSPVIVAKVFDDSGDAVTTDVAAAWSGLYDQGVRLFNNSLGSTNTYSASDLLVQTAAKLINGGSLLVFATGNDGNSQPNSEAALGVSFSALQPGLIAVAGSNAAGDGLHSESNACGSAASYCLSAPYESETLLKASATTASPNNYTTVTGTSMSTPLVTGTAAQVWDKYPWMSNSNVQQTILTTASYVGSASDLPYNEETGWGILDSEKALNGPAMFYDSDFEADVSSGSYAFDNDISGNAGLQKSGSGTLVLSGANSYSGATSISAGELQVTGSLSGEVSLAGGVLSGSGSVGAVSNTAGTLSTEQGGLTITGDYRQDAQASLDAYVGNTLGISGSASLDGTLNILSDGSYITAGSYSLLTADEGIDGDFSSVNTASVFLSSSTSKDTNNYSIQITQVSASSNTTLTATAAGAVGASALDTMFESANTLSQAQASGQQLSSDQTSFLSTAANIQAASSDTVALMGADSHSGTAYAQVPSALLQAQEVIQQVAVNHVHQALNAAQSSSGAWAGSNYITGSTSPAGWNHADTDIHGLTIGYDHRLGPHSLVGGFISQSSIETDWSRFGGKLENKPIGAGLYGRSMLGSAYVLGLANVQYSEADLDRYLVDGSQITHIKAETDTWAAGLYGEFGYRLNAPSHALTYTPFLSLSYDYSRMDSFSDVGGNGSGLKLSAMSVKQAAAQIGLRVSAQLHQRLRIEGHFSRKQIFDRHAQNLTAAFQIDPSNTYDIDGPAWGKASQQLGLSLMGSLGQHAHLYLSATRKYGDDTSFNSFAAGYRYNF